MSFETREIGQGQYCGGTSQRHMPCRSLPIYARGFLLISPILLLCQLYCGVVVSRGYPLRH